MIRHVLTISTWVFVVVIAMCMHDNVFSEGRSDVEYGLLSAMLETGKQRCPEHQRFRFAHYGCAADCYRRSKHSHHQR